MDALVKICDLTMAFRLNRISYPVIMHVDLDVRPGEILGLVGESGSGKSVTAKAVMGLNPSPPCQVLGGQILFEGRDLLNLSEAEMQRFRGNRISMIFQEPMTSLNPVYTCGNQIVEAIRNHQHISRSHAEELAEQMLHQVGMSSPRQRLKNYPFELSGGMRQRVMIAMALSCNPTMLIADEPTTALDPTIQAQILELIRSLQRERRMSVMYITHDLGVVASLCDRVAVLYAGMIMEVAPVREIFDRPMHPYTQGLMHAIPRVNARKEKLYNIRGSVPQISQMIDMQGCHFHPRCAHATERCAQECPQIQDAGSEHQVRCFHWQNLSS